MASAALFVLAWGTVVVLQAPPAAAAGAAPIDLELTQPDGSIFNARQFGDEWENGFETARGYTIVRDPLSRYWAYAKVKPSGDLAATNLLVGLDAPKGISKHVRAEPAKLPDRDLTASSENVGTQSSLVILVEFPDQSAVETTPADWSAMYFGVSNSVRDYYDEVSLGQLAIDPAEETHGTVDDGVVGWVEVESDHPNTGGDTGEANRLLTRDAVLAADPYVDFATYDIDDDGFLSATELHVTVVVAGYERSYGPGCGNSVWGHQWSLFGDEVPTVDGVVFGDFSEGGGYTQFGEMHCDHMATLGIMVHEIGHDLGLPDLYDTDLSSAGVGEWSVMSYGSWLAMPGEDAGSMPTHPDAFSRAYEGWVTPELLVGTHSDTAIPEIETTGTVYQLLENANGIDWTWLHASGTGEYFLVENRQRSGYDAALEGCGLLIWHIDETRTEENTANADEERKLVDLEEADGLDQIDLGTSYSDEGDPYPGTSSNQAFDQTSYPDSDLYSGMASGVSVTNISSCSSTMTADLSTLGGAEGPAQNDFNGDGRSDLAWRNSPRVRTTCGS